ncbi:predicted protein [Postia placenta Mad-698-R]|uniref:Uncharacterized protein n=1 Tax=Postia placenta MAD-698-R-SB12 TaxID=670580 RepID=A0A1X6NEE2_9APHY|nr:hypothetical protein POSPLADRAFT_1042286 [Postia placenta MAD-698-R-SB12]EED80218.1 predicted protein [Postia placenta Mad-698-R]OSX66998.1 hypothetical protein POSPLADRAFT_1042286 [Postia placenta MAD-698-R-SB12]
MDQDDRTADGQSQWMKTMVHGLSLRPHGSKRNEAHSTAQVIAIENSPGFLVHGKRGVAITCGFTVRIQRDAADSSFSLSLVITAFFELERGSSEIAWGPRRPEARQQEWSSSPDLKP